MPETVTVTLDRQRPYRANHEDKDALWVGPGEVEVPRWVAYRWKMISTPIEGYNDLSMTDIVALMAEMDAPTREVIREHEAAHKNRKGIVEA